MRRALPLLLVCSVLAACRGGYEETPGGYYENAPDGKSYLELDKRLYEECDLVIDDGRSRSWFNHRTKLRPGSHTVSCTRMGSVSTHTYEIKPGKILHLRWL